MVNLYSILFGILGVIVGIFLIAPISYWGNILGLIFFVGGLGLVILGLLSEII
jgi:hypothetical protein